MADRPAETSGPAADGAVTAEPDCHALPAATVVASLQVDPEHGLSAGEAARRVEQFGANDFDRAEVESRLHAFVRQFADPMQIVLLVAGVVSLYPLRELETGLVLVGLTLFNAALGLSQEGKAAAAVAALQQMMIVKARVLRDGRLVELPASQLVPGDIVSIEAGDVVPADGRLLRASTLEVAEGVLTGESVAVAKSTDPVPPDAVLGDRTAMVYLNTSVTRGSGDLVVTATGMATEVGRVSGMLESEETRRSPLTRQLDRLTRQILSIAGVALVASMGMNLYRGTPFDEVFIAGVAFAVGALPENLPAVVTTILAYGTQSLAKAGAIMKRMQSTETLGSTSAINSDKTGTLTLNQMTAVRLSLVGRRYSVEGEGYSGSGRITQVAGQPETPLGQFLMPLALASDAVVRDGELIGDPTEGALVALAAKGGIDVEETRRVYPRVAELPFDAAYKLMATFHAMHDDAGRPVIRCFVKGAPDQLLARAATVYDADQGAVPADGTFRERYEAENRTLGGQGLRVIATARKDFDPASFDPTADLLTAVDDLELLGLVGIVDPPRPTAKAAVAAATDAGIRVRMITGDHAVTAGAIAGQLGIEGRVITGAEFSALSDDEASQVIDEVGVIARVTPEDKVRLVDLLRDKGDIVAMTGDGVNDAPALKRADIGIAMGIAGTEVSKEAAVMILTDDNFATIVHAIELGRGLYDNLTKYVRFQMGCLFGFIISFLGASIFNITSGVPFLPLQTLWINFTTLLFQAIGLGYGRAASGLMQRKPRPPDEPILTRDLMTWLIAVGLVIGVTTLVGLRWAEDQRGEAVAHTMGVVIFSLCAIAFSLATRDEHRTVFSIDVLTDQMFLLCTALSVVTLYLSTSFGPLQTLLDTTDLTGSQWLVCAGGAVVLLVLTELRKLLHRVRA